MRRYIKRDRFGGLRKRMEGMERWVEDWRGRDMEGGGSTVEWCGELRVIDR